MPLYQPIVATSQTLITGGGTLALGGFTLTVPATGTTALLATANAFTAAQGITVDDAATSGPSTLLTIDHTTSGVAGSGFGTQVLFRLESSTGALRNAAAIVADWQTAADSTRSGRISFGVDAAGVMGYPFIVTKTGVTFNATGAANGDVLFEVSDSGTAALRVTKNSANGLVAVFQPASGTATALNVRAGSSATGNLQGWLNSSGTIQSRIDKSGYIMTRRVSAPADGDLATSELAIWLDDTAGAANLMIKAKNASGTVVTGSVALT